MDNQQQARRSMWSFVFELFSFALILTITSCTSSNEPTVYTPPRQLTAGEEKLVSVDNSFGFKLFKEVNSEDGDKNVVISPLSISMALGMTVNGAAGETRDAMLKTMELYGLSMDEVNQSYRTLIDLLANLDPKVKFQLANSIWYRNDYKFEQTFFDLCKQYFDAEVIGLNFNESEKSKEIINNWVNEKTKGKIKDIVDQIDGNSMMFLINAIYFKGAWHSKFEPKDTYKGKFTKLNGEKQDCDMMKQESQFEYYSNDYFQIVDMPYSFGDWSMTIFLPQLDKSFNECVAAFTKDNYEQWIANLDTEKIAIEMPKFKIEYKTSLNNTLKKLGMGIAFIPGEADFTNMSELYGERLYIDSVKHKTFIQVDEEGTEAAAVTSVEIGLKSMPKLKNVMINRPFLFVLRDTHSGTILFIGKILEIES
ncbi:MAG TPA: serpin family protein [Candidatus Kapabacteria bacterium]|nr:serpin family protein [Candidatus Kapabacteria bacterium]